mgnify:CR=1|jgi:C4-dicarboxylate transporter DctQ subunit
MSGASIILEDGSLLSRLDRLYFKIESFLTLIGGIAIFALVILAVANALGRWIFNLPVTGYIDWVEQVMAVMAFGGLAYSQRIGGHIRMDIFLSVMKGRTLWITELVTTLFMLFITLVLTYGSYLHFYRAFTNGDSSMDIGLPIWPAKLVVPFAFAVLTLRLLLQIWGYIRAIKNNDIQPVGVPLIEDAATQALREAKSVEGKEND